MKQILYVAGLLAFSVSAFAGNVTWTLPSTHLDTFGDNTISGTFDYNADTDVYSSISLTDANSTSFTYFGGGSSAALTVFSGPTGGDLIGTSIISLTFDGALTNAGGVVNLLLASTGTCNQSNCSGWGGGGFGHLSGGGFVTAEGEMSGTPEPASMGLVALGLAGLAYARRRVR